MLVSQQTEPLKIKKGENRFRFRQTIDNESQTDFAVGIRKFQDTLLDNNAASAVVFAAGKPSILIVDSVNPAGQFINQADTKLTLIDSALGHQEISLSQSGPGRYEADFATPKAGAYQLELSQQKDDVVLFRQSRGIVVGYPNELRLGPPDEDLMRRIASVSGGRFNPTPAQIFEPTALRARQVTPLWPYLLSAALVLFLFDVALRRIDFSLWV